jgi:hypothetical protein
VRGYSPIGTGVEGNSDSTNGVAGSGVIGVSGKGSDTGVDGTGEVGVSGTGVTGVTGTGDFAGVTGTSSSSEGTGVDATSNSPVGVGVHATAPLDPTHYIWARKSWAGLFDGDVQINGDLALLGQDYVVHKQLRYTIDHPIDPANKYLNHYSVQSPDMKNVHDGVVLLDTSGEAIVDLPEWFEALNTHFCYQLTPVGAAGPNLHIAEEIYDSRFKIAGGTPDTKVSWQVTGIRKDQAAEANRISVEEEKPAEEQGLYLHPELYGQREELGIGWARREEQRRQMEERRQRMEENKRQQAGESRTE